MIAWQPRLGAWRAESGFRCRVWAPESRRVEIVVEPAGAARRVMALAREADGMFAGLVTDVAAGDRYAYLLDGDGPFPDPASRAQPDGVHGLSAFVDPRAFTWSDRGWRGMPLDEAAIYELHVGTFSPAGTFDGVRERLPYLADLGVTVLEVMPVADFPGRRNWGYDGVSLFAPARCYGAPDDLRRLVDAAHGHGLAVILDVVYNHLGPDGAYAGRFSPHYFSRTHQSPWGAAVNLDGEHAAAVRGFFIENALHWLHEYRFDGLRLDATHAMVDESPRHVIRELTTTVRGSIDDRRILIVAEDDRNLAEIVRPAAEGGWGADAVIADDFHHEARRLAAGDADGYFVDYTGTTTDLAATIRRGWFFAGQHSGYRNAPRGDDPAGVPVNRMVICLQNHDQVGNRAFGERLNQQIDPAVFRALTALLLLAPETPLLFMGQEWASDSPFQYFTDHTPELGRLVTEGRRREFARFAAFASEADRARIPDPQAEGTFRRSRLNWQEPDEPAHAGVLELHRALLRLRREEPALRTPGGTDVTAVDAATIALVRRAPGHPSLLVVVHVGRGGTTDLRPWIAPQGLERGVWTTVLTTEDPDFLAPDDRLVTAGINVNPAGAAPRVTFSRAGAAILRVA